MEITWFSLIAYNHKALPDKIFIIQNYHIRYYNEIKVRCMLEK